jgi:hypothetical protein
MTLERLLYLHHANLITDLDFVNRLPDVVTRDNVDSVMNQVPQRLLEEIKDHLEDYDPNTRIFIGGVKPYTQEAVHAIREWFRTNESKS